MVKSYVAELEKVYDAILKDAEYAYPALAGEFAKDRIRLSHLVEQRGIHVFVVELPALGKHLDRCLSNGQYKLSGLPCSKRFSNRVVIPKLFRGLYLLIFDEQGGLKEEPDVQAICFLRQVLYLAKKAQLDCGEEACAAEATQFLLTDQDLPEPEVFWTGESATEEEFSQATPGFQESKVISSFDGLPSRDWQLFLGVLDTVSGILTSTLGPYRVEEWRFRHGPGVTSEGNQFRNKYLFQNWSDRLESVFALADCGFHNYASWSSVIGERKMGSDDPASRLIAVPKTYTKPRLIAAEPSEHQWCQQNIWDYFCNRVRSSWINDFVRFRDQSLNQELCRVGSRDGSLATLDLSEASDRVTCHVVAQVFRRNPRLLYALRASRTRWMTESISREGTRTVQLKKFSTMGSSVTFPVESLVFLTVAISCVLWTRGMKATERNIRSLAGQVAVYGDDIIVPVASRVLLCGVLEALYFKVNLGKSYWTGKFRESCGVDSFDGVNVSPVYWKAPYKRQPESFASTVGTMNNFYKKFFIRTAEYLASTIRGYSIPAVPYDSGFCGRVSFVPRDPMETHRSRWNSELQRVECLVPSLSTKARRTPVTDDTGLLQYFTERPSSQEYWESGVAQRPKSSLRLRWVPLQDLR